MIKPINALVATSTVFTMFTYLYQNIKEMILSINSNFWLV
jgi:hypothetical protein